MCKVLKFDISQSDKIEEFIENDAKLLIGQKYEVVTLRDDDALYAFTNCEVSIAPLSCSIHEDTPLFLGVSDILRRSTEATKQVLKAELEIRLSELQEQN